MTPDPLERAAVLAAYAALPQSHRTALDLVRAGHSFQSVASNAGIPLVTVRRWVLHAVCALSQARLASTASTVTGST